jgi:hypothetical protein
MASGRMMSLLTVMIGVGVANGAFMFQGNEIVLESWAGSETADYSVALVIDFWPGNGQADSFAFGYRFDAADLTVKDMLDDFHSADNGLTFATAGGFLNDIWYEKDEVTYHATYDWPNSWWSQWVSTDGMIWGWGNGLDDTLVNDGSIHGLLAKPGDDWGSEPVVPVPEPVTFALLAFGGLMLGRKRK